MIKPPIRADLSVHAPRQHADPAAEPHRPADAGRQSTPTTEKLAVEVVGAGYVGLVTAACLASLGHWVRCSDADADRVEGLSRGEVPFLEPRLDGLVRAGIASGRLTFGTDVAHATRRADIAFIAVGTLDGTGEWTDRNVEAVLRSLLASASVPKLIVIRSTLRPGRMDRLDRLVRGSGHDTTLLLHPEFTKEGAAVSDFLAPSRIVVGIPPTSSHSVADPLRTLYAGVDAPFLVVDHASAEMIKIGSNAFLATKITFANELARYCQAVGADARAVREGLGMDPRIGPLFLRTGPGFGGSCLPSQVDLLALMNDELQLGAEVLPAVKRFNDRQPAWIVDEILTAGDRVRSIAVLGLAFKAGTDDLRASPALKIIDALIAGGVESISAFDPAISALPSRPQVRIAASLEDAVTGAELAIIATEWPAFQAADWGRLGSAMRRRDVFDARGILDPKRADLERFRVRSLERQPTMPMAPLPDVMGPLSPGSDESRVVVA